MEYKGIITLDAGHGGKDPGAIGRDGSNEKDNTLAQTIILKNHLEEQGFKIYLTRDKDEFVSLTSRKNLADNYKSDLIISIHNNSFSDPKSKGIETWNYPGSTNGNKAGIYAQNELIDATNLTNRGNKEAKFTVLTGKSPAILIELGFISNDIECKLLADRNYQNTVAIAITKGVCKYFNVPYIERIAITKPNIKTDCDCLGHGTVAATALNVRVKPIDGNIVGQLKSGDKVSVIAIVDDWYKIIFENHVRYVSSKFIKID